MNDQERARIQEQYPAWHIRRPPNATCLIATRRGGPLSMEELYQGLCTTLIEDSYKQLQESLAHQRKIEESL